MLCYCTTMLRYVIAAPAAPVKKRPTFKVGMKLEAVDQRFPYFVCVATVMDRNGSSR